MWVFRGTFCEYSVPRVFVVLHACMWYIVYGKSGIGRVDVLVMCVLRYYFFPL